MSANVKGQGLFNQMGLGLPDSSVGNDLLRARIAQNSGGGQAGGIAGRVGGNVAVGGRQLGAALGGLFQAARGQGSGGFVQRLGENTQQIAQNAGDREIAAAMGITPEELAARRETEENLRAFTPKSSDPLEAQLEVAQHTAATTRSPFVRQQATQLAQQLMNQQKQFERLGVQTEKEKADAKARGMVTLYDKTNPNDKQGSLFPTSSIDLQRQVATRPDGTEVPLENLTTRPPPSATQQPTRQKSTAGWIKDTFSSSERKNLRQLVNDAGEMTRQMTKTVAPIMQAINEGKGTDFIVRPFGAVNQLTDTALRTVQAAMRAISPDMDVFEGKHVQQDTENYLGPSNAQPNRELEGQPLGEIILLPEGVSENSANSTVYRANIMNLAYLVARTQEPGGRGLSDNDIKAALQKLGVTTGNPQVIFRNFADELFLRIASVQAQANSSVQSVVSGSDGEVTPEQVRAGLYGGADATLLRELEKFQKITGAEPVGLANRAFFERPVGAGQQPDARLEQANPPQRPQGAARAAESTNAIGGARVNDIMRQLEAKRAREQQ